MEKNVLDDCGFVTSLQFLYDLTGVCAVNLDDVTSLGSRGDQCTVWVDGDGSDLGVMCWNDKVNTFIDNCRKNLSKLARCFEKNLNK